MGALDILLFLFQGDEDKISIPTGDGEGLQVLRGYSLQALLLGFGLSRKQDFRLDIIKQTWGSKHRLLDI